MSESLKRPDGHAHHRHHQHDNNGIEAEPLDPASKALAEGLRLMFIVLKIVMLCAIGLFVYSGVFEVGQNEQAVVLQFGRIEGVGPQAIKKAGLHWAWPYPIEEIIRIPTAAAEKKLDIDSLWYYQTEQEKAGVSKAPPRRNIQFVRDGYHLTASRSEAQKTSQTSGQKAPMADYNLMHSKWRVRYRVSDPIRLLERLWDGTEGTGKKRDGWYAVTILLRNVVDDAVIVTSANRDIDWILFKEPKQFRDEVKERAAKHIKSLGVGLDIVALDLIDKKPPRQVQADFDAAFGAETELNQRISQAHAMESQIINAAQAHAEKRLADAQAYRKKVAQAAKGDAKYLEEVLDSINEAAQQAVPQSAKNYQEKFQAVHDDLLAQTVDQLYQETLRQVMADADEIFVISATEDGQVEWRPYFSRDATLGRKKSKKTP